MLSIAIIDDEKTAVNELKDMLSRYAKDEGESIKFDVFENAEKFLYDYRPEYDVVFMDIEMDGMNGMEAAKRMRKQDENVFLIFVTNMAQYALNGYKVDALDYFVKPINYYDLKMRLKRVKRLMKSREEKLISVPQGGGVKTMPASDVFYVEVQNHTIIWHTASGDYPCRGSSMRDIEKQLASYGFARCNVCYLVNLKHCTELSADSVTVGGGSLRISRPKRKEFTAALEQYIKHGVGGGY